MRKKKEKNVQEGWTCPTDIDHFYWIMEDLCCGIMTSVRGTSGVGGVAKDFAPETN